MMAAVKFEEIGELELVESKILKEKTKMNKKGEKYLSEGKALAKYR